MPSSPRRPTASIERGLRLADITPILEASSGRNNLSADAGEAATFYAKSAGTRHGFQQLTSIMRKGLGLALEMASASPGAYPVLESLVSSIDALGDETFDTWRVVGGTAED